MKHRLAGVLLLGSAALSVEHPLYAAQDEDFMEEILVIGSYLKRDPADSPSPLSLITSADIEDLGAVDVSEILRTMPWQSGSQVRTTTFGGEGGDGRIAINLRNLGNASTLPLLNGKRQVASYFTGNGNAAVDVNKLVPNIAIERIEVLKDGASPLYGSDAVAGVVNFLTKKNFEGFEFQAEASTDEATRLGDVVNLAAIYGAQGERARLVISASTMRREEINVDDRYDDYGVTTSSGTGQPGFFFPISPIRWLDGTPARDPAQPANPFRMPRDPNGSAWGNGDLDCENSAALERGGTLGLVIANNVCVYDFGSFFPIQGEEDYDKIFLTAGIDVSESVELYAEAGISRSEFFRLNSWNPNSDAALIPPNNFGLIEDAARRGIIAQPLVNVSRTIGGTRNTPFEQRPTRTFTDIERENIRLVMGALWDTELWGRDWSLDLSVSTSEYEADQINRADTLAMEFANAIRGLGGPNCDPATGTPGEGNLAYAASGGDFTSGSCYFFNPFGSHQFAADGSFQSAASPNASVANGLVLRNPPELYKWLEGTLTNDLEVRNVVVDAVFSGAIADLPAGPVGLALGVQRRKDNAELIVDAGAGGVNNLAFAVGARSFRGSITTQSAFAELAVPVTETLDVSFAVRYEDFREFNQDTTDPKLSVLWRPFETLSVRASWGTSFRLASLQQAYSSATPVRIQTDPLLGFGTGPLVDPDPNRIFDLESATRTELAPEEAEVFNIGVSWQPNGALEGLEVGVDFYNYDYTDLIRLESAGRLANQDAAAFLAQRDLTGQSLTDLVAESIACFAATGDGGQCVGNPRQVVRDPASARIVTVTRDYINADTLDVTGLDVNFSYTWTENASGFWRFGLQGAWISKYEIGIRSAGGTLDVVDGAGTRNGTNQVGRPLPEWKINGTINWSRNAHSVFLLVQYVDSYKHDGRQNQALIAAARDFAGIDLNRPKIDSHMTADLHYTYTLPEFQSRSLGELTLGARNITDEDPPLVNQVHGFEPTLHDPLGRIWYLRYRFSL